MADNLEKNIKQIAEFLSQDGIIDNLKEMLNNKGSKSSSKNSIEKFEKQFVDKTTPDNHNNDMHFIQNMVRAMSQLKDTNDPGTNLLSAISPFLNKKRQKTCSDCVKILKTVKLFEFMKQHGEDFNL